MIPSHLSLVTLNPARQAALQAIAEVEQRQENSQRLPFENPHARAFMRRLTGSSRLNARSAQQIPGLGWDPKFKLWTLKMLEDELERLLRSRGEHCYSPLSSEVQHALFPDIVYRKSTRNDRSRNLSSARSQRREDKRRCQEAMRHQNLVIQARTDLNFQSPETVRAWYSRWCDELHTGEMALLFWHWQTRFGSLKELAWLRYSSAPLHEVLLEIHFMVPETPDHIRAAERWMVPNKLSHRRTPGGL